MAQLITLLDDHGDFALSLKSTINFATAIAEHEGFEVDGHSNLSEAVYLRRPGRDDQLRIAAHAGQRDHVSAVALYPQERRMVDDEYTHVVPLSPDRAYAIIRQAIADYDSAKEGLQ